MCEISFDMSPQMQGRQEIYRTKRVSELLRVGVNGILLYLLDAYSVEDLLKI